jgi:uncharacterized protein
MNSQERDQLSQFLKQLTEVKLSEKDTEAEALIREAASRQPDAAYLLVQRTMLLEQALNSAKSQINDLQNQLQSGQSGSRSGFLNNDPWAQSASPGQVPGAGNYQMPRYAQQPAPAQQPGFLGGGGSSFLGNVATTAAGVVAGSFLFQGIENLMGHHSSPWSQSAHNGGLGDQPVEQTVINNYYGDDADPNQSAIHDASYTDYSNDDDNDSFQDDNDSDWI